jgi:very-short-patch-repair endonuclease
MSKREQAMYWRLKETFPEWVVLAQVAFAAFITSPFKHRNRYDRKIADFVLCDPSMRIQGVFELDDASHEGRGASDAARQALLTTAGYKVLRFANVPNQDELKARVDALLSSTSVPVASKPRKPAAIAKSAGSTS